MSVLDKKDIEIVDLRGRINSLEILGKRYEARIRELEEFLRRLDRRGGLGLDVHAEIAAVLGTSQSDR